MYRKYPEAVKQQVKQLRLEGKTTSEISKIVNLNKTTVSRWVKNLPKPPHCVVGYKILTKERLQALVKRKLTGQEIADQVGCSLSTVRNSLANYNLQLYRHNWGKGTNQHGITIKKWESYPNQIQKECIKHGVTKYIKLRKFPGRYTCATCNYQFMKASRNIIRQKLVDYHGGKCIICTYNFHLGALHFHHVYPEDKAFTISANRYQIAYHRLLKESMKCVLLCSNCHAEVSAGLHELGYILQAYQEIHGRPLQQASM